MEPRLVKLLGQFQLLEFSLKLYIYFSHEIIRARVSGLVPFKYTFEQLDSHPLEKLLATFRQLSDNSELQGRLNELPKKRNEIAHKALLYHHPSLSALLAGIYNLDYIEHSADVGETEKEIESCMDLLAEDLATVRGTFESLRA